MHTSMHIHHFGEGYLFDHDFAKRIRLGKCVHLRQVIATHVEVDFLPQARCAAYSHDRSVQLVVPNANGVKCPGEECTLECEMASSSALPQPQCGPKF